MKEFPTVYVVDSYDDGVQAGFYNYDEAVDWCNDRLEEWDVQDSPWTFFFTITQIKVK